MYEIRDGDLLILSDGIEDKDVAIELATQLFDSNTCHILVTEDGNIVALVWRWHVYLPVSSSA